MKKFLLSIAISLSLFANCADLSNEIENLKKLLPMYVDKDIVMTKVACEESVMTYLFELNKEKKYGWSSMSERDINDYNIVLKPMFIEQYCTDPDLKSNREYSVALRYIYKLQDGKVFTDVTVSNKECK